MKSLNIVSYLVLLIFLISTINMYGQKVITEIDKITMGKNISTPWQYTYEYMRNNSFRFYKRSLSSVTFDFRYRNPEYIFVDKNSTLIVNFDDGTSAELYNIQNNVYMPYLIGATKYYDIEVKYKLRNGDDLNNFANKLITSIRFNYRTPKDESYREIKISDKRAENLKSVYSAFSEAINNDKN